jgi:hypothetical protein
MPHRNVPGLASAPRGACSQDRGTMDRRSENLVVEAPPFLDHDQAGVVLALMSSERMFAFLRVQIASRKLWLRGTRLF